MLGSLAASAVAAEGGPLYGQDPDAVLAHTAGRPIWERLIDVMTRSGPYGVTIDDLEAHPHGIDFGPLEPNLRNTIRTPDGRVAMFPEVFADELDQLAASMADDLDADALLLVGRRDLRSNNSWMHNVEVLVKGKPRCTLHVNPRDADRLALVDGGSAAVTSAVGTLVAPVEVTDAIASGVVSLPHGWGHGADGTRLSVAARYVGVNSNILTDPAITDPLSGNAQLNAIPVTVAPA
jgi:anaerobic selenocysteine-containing dehydrogenase